MQKLPFWRFLVLFFVTGSTTLIVLSKTARLALGSFNFSKKYYG